MAEVVELRADGYTVIDRIEVMEGLKQAHIPAWAHPWGVDMTISYERLEDLVVNLLRLCGLSHHSIFDYVALMRRNLTNLYMHRV